jgi:uncharacterized protein
VFVIMEVGTRKIAHLFKTRQSKAFGFWTAALLLSILFGVGHKQNPGESPIGLLAAGLAGLVFSLSLWRTGSLWWAMVSPTVESWFSTISLPRTRSVPR